MEILVLVVMFLIYSLVREFLFAKTLKEALTDMEQMRQKPLQDLARKTMAKDLNDLRPMSEPNNLSTDNDNLLDLTDQYSMALPKEMGLEIEGADGKSLFKTTVNN